MSNESHPLTGGVPRVKRHQRHVRPTRLLIMGPQGSGKGTQAKRIAATFDIPTISTGDIFRANIKGNTALGRIAKEYTDKGELVPDEITNAMVKDRLSANDVTGGFLLDGYPRTAAQVEALDQILTELGYHPLDGVIELTADRDELMRRIAGRAVAEGRDDDTPAAIERRLELYEKSTAPLTKHFQEKGLLAKVDGMGEVEEVTDRIVAALDAL
jgi:adenylate kinase